MDQNLKLTEQSVDLPLDGLLNNETSSEAPVPQQSQPAPVSLMPATAMVSIPQGQPSTPSQLQAILPIRSVPQKMVQNITKNMPVQLQQQQPIPNKAPVVNIPQTNMLKQQQLMQTVQNQPLRQMAQLMQQQTMQPMQYLQPMQQPVQSLQPMPQQIPQQQVPQQVHTQPATPLVPTDNFKGVNIFGLKISRMTIFITVVVIGLLVGYYFYSKSKNKTEKKPTDAKEVKEVSYEEQKKVMGKGKKDKKKKKKREPKESEDN